MDAVLYALIAINFLHKQGQFHVIFIYMCCIIEGVNTPFEQSLHTKAFQTVA